MGNLLIITFVCFLVLASVVNIGLCLYFERSIAQATIGSVLSAVFFLLLLKALRDRQLNTLQDGLISARENPVRFLTIVAIFVFGVCGGLIYAWSS